MQSYLFGEDLRRLVLDVQVMKPGEQQPERRVLNQLDPGVPDGAALGQGQAPLSAHPAVQLQQLQVARLAHPGDR